MPLVPASSVEKQKKEQETHFSSKYYCIPSGILANLKKKPFIGATHEGINHITTS